MTVSILHIQMVLIVKKIKSLLILKRVELSDLITSLSWHWNITISYNIIIVSIFTIELL